MEVHHHAHASHGKKNWKSYFREFIMLFLAVFCGFLAEYQLEHKIEGEREEQYVKSMLEDLKTDTARISRFSVESDSNQFKIDSLIQLLRRPDRHLYGNTIYYFARIITVPASRFELNDRTYDQMKSSGMLRLMTDKAVSDSVSTYYAAQANFKQQEELQLTRMNTYFDMTGKVFDGAVFQDMMEKYPYTYHRPDGNPQLITTDAAIINEYIVKLHYFGGMMLINCSKARQKRDATLRLMQLLQAKYHLD
ncbi:MAG: hypothetical protein JNL88_00460 [Bacteroidia bacterium]|nr:hypothetical protein [Bacteroidia bacterium]